MGSAFAAAKSELENDGHAHLISKKKFGEEENNDAGGLEKLIINFAWPNGPYAKLYFYLSTEVPRHSY